jgi:hypothetical protein
MNRKTLTSLGAYIVTLATAASVLAQTPPMQDAMKKQTPAYAQTNLVTSGKPLKGKVRDKNLLNPWGSVQGQTPSGFPTTTLEYRRFTTATERS